MQELATLSQELEVVEQEYDAEAERFWNALDKEQQLMLFYSVVKRIVQGELRDQGSYRYVLYDVFGFGMESYVTGMNCGFLELHNSIYTQEETQVLFNKVLNENH